VSEREEEAGAERPLAFGHQLASRVVDRGDVVGAERVAEPERVGRDPEADGECSSGTEPVVMGGDDGDQDEESPREVRSR
jgi:hypothetical protein